MSEPGISKDEVSLYDRQIRLWGIDGQARLSSASILFISIKGVAVEALKNIVLAGVGSVTLLDSESVTDQDLGVNFFVRADDIGMNRARATARRASVLNPRVSVLPDDQELSDITDHYFTEFDIVIMAGASVVDLQRVNRVTHNAGKAFYAAGSMSWAGYTFVDLASHTYTVERPIVTEPTPTGPEGFAREITEVKVRPDGQSEVLTIKESFGNLAEVLHRSQHPPFAEKLSPKARSRVSPYLPAILAAWDSPSLSTADIEARAKSLGLSSSLVSGEFGSEFVSALGVELSPVASVVGGFVSQDALNYLTGRQHPIQNLLIYDAKKGIAPVYLL